MTDKNWIGGLLSGALICGVLGAAAIFGGATALTIRIYGETGIENEL